MPLKYHKNFLKESIKTFVAFQIHMEKSVFFLKEKIIGDKESISLHLVFV